VDIDCVLAPFPPFAVGAITLKVTPGGTESGSDPILDWHRAVVVKVLGAANRGKRNVGIDSVAGEMDLEMACAHRRRAGANMVSWSAVGLGEVFWRRECEVAMFSPMELSHRSSDSRLPSQLQCLFVVGRRVQLLNTTLILPSASILSCCTILCRRLSDLLGCISPSVLLPIALRLTTHPLTTDPALTQPSGQDCTLQTVKISANHRSLTVTCIADTAAATTATVVHQLQELFSYFPNLSTCLRSFLFLLNSSGRHLLPTALIVSVIGVIPL
jgi:hypothetical protein